MHIGKVFYELSERIKENNYEQPNVIYDLAYKAQKESLKNRKGGKINFGIIELLVPIVTTQILFKNYDISVLDKVETVLKNTSREDVDYHYKFRKLARSVSKQFPNTESYSVSNMYDYYKISKSQTENNVHREYTTKFERIKEAYAILEKNDKDANLLDTTVLAYNTILEKCDNYFGLAADYICIALYFYLFNYPEAIIV